MAKKAQPKGIKKIKQQTFVIDCSKPVEDKIMEIAAFSKFLTDKIKVNGKTGITLVNGSAYASPRVLNIEFKKALLGDCQEAASLSHGSLMYDMYIQVAIKPVITACLLSGRNFN